LAKQLTNSSSVCIAASTLLFHYEPQVREKKNEKQQNHSLLQVINVSHTQGRAEAKGEAKLS